MKKAGGLAGRRAVVRWAVRLFRREWRQQFLVLALLVVAVAAGTAGESAAFNIAPSRDAQFGSATFRLQLGRDNAATLQADVAAARAWFGTVDVITHGAVAVPGSAETLDVRAQDPKGPYGAPTLRLVAGRYPAADTEVAVTAGVATTLGTGIGASALLGGRPATVVGVVENPGDLDDEFALLAPGNTVGAQSAVVLLRTGEDRIDGFRATDGSRPRVERRPGVEKASAAVGGFAAGTIVLLLISLVAAASFAVIAQRRLRQLGMLAAIGATQKQLRLVMVANGVVVGVVAAVLGTLAGLSAWVAAAPRLENAVGHRIDRLDLPWPVLGLGMLMAVIVATGAAWWPARSVARIPVTLALSARVPRPKSVHRSAVAAGLLLVAGFVCLDAGIDPVHDSGNPLLVIAGIVGTVGGLVLVSPVAVRTLAAAGGRAPIPVRLALRDLGRYQARSASALAAISLTLGIAVTVVLLSSAAVATASEGNLSSRQLLVHLAGSDLSVPDLALADLQRLQADVDRFAATLDHAGVVGLDVAVDPTAQDRQKGKVSRPIVSLGRLISPGTRRFVGVLYVATPELLAHLGLSGRPIDPATDVLTIRTGDLAYVNGPRAEAPTPKVETIDVPSYSSPPTSLITVNGLRRAGWQAQRAGWLIETRTPLTAAQLRAARDMAAGSGLTVEARDPQRTLGAIQTSATAAGALLALGVLAMTVGLIRSESAADLRTLTAAGATSRVRRTITATTAAALGLLGVVIGTATAYVGLIGGYSGKLGALGHVPIVHLAVTIVGVPTVAGVAGWLLAGREPATLGRTTFA